MRGEVGGRRRAPRPGDDHLQETDAAEDADDRLIDFLGSGGEPADDSALTAMLSALRDEADR